MDLRRYVRAIRENKVFFTLFVFGVSVVLLQAVPAFANSISRITVSAIPQHNSPPTITTAASSGYMDGDGTHATLVGSLDDLGGIANCDIWFEWGYNGSYTNIVDRQTVTSTGTYTFDISGFNPTETVNFRFVGENVDGRAYGDGVALQMDGGNAVVVSAYRVVSTSPLIYVAALSVSLVAIMIGGIGLSTLVIGAISICMASAFLSNMQIMLTALWAR